MTVQKTPVSLIQVLDAEGKVSNYEIEYLKVYVGDDPDIARNFVSTRDREEVSAEAFAQFRSGVDTASAASVQALSAQVEAQRIENASLHDRLASEAAAHEAIAEQLRQNGLALEAQKAALLQRISEARKLLS